jgi:hypothetical protein
MLRRKPKHVCQWGVVKSRYMPPTGARRGLKGGDKVLREAMFGMTATTLRCRECKNLKVVESIGDSRVPVEIPEDLL